MKSASPFLPGTHDLPIEEGMVISLEVPHSVLGLGGFQVEYTLLVMEGDFEFTDGIRVYKTPGHTAGSMSIAVRTQKGLQVLTGDHFHIFCMAFPKQTEIMDMQGKKHKITPAPEVLGPFIPSTLIYDYYDYYDSSYKIMSIVGEYKTEFLIPGHEPSLLVTGA